jgi:heat shock protein HslJ
MKKVFQFTGIILLLSLVSCKSNKIEENNSNNQNETTINKDFENQITEKYWKLIKLSGQDIEMAENQEREMFFMLKEKENRVQGFAGCNKMSGTYKLEKGNRINFSQMAATRKACTDLILNETDFLKVFELTDNYTIANDTLSLHVGRRAPLAVFEAVYFN